jgi:glycosyltransferase involved in cell wall biosynthesis
MMQDRTQRHDLSGSDGVGASDETTGTARFAFVIPVYNHGGTVRTVVTKAMGLGYPVVVVNDGSSDSTEAELGSITGIQVLNHRENLGKGAALLTGFKAAAEVADYAITLDADGQHEPGEATTLVRAIRRDERVLVLGCRQGMEDVSIPWTSRFGRRFSNFWVWVSGGPKVSDSQSGYRIYPVPETLELEPRRRRFDFEVEILVLAKRQNLPVRQVPIGVSYTPEGERISHFRPFVDFWRNSVTFTRLIVERILLFLTGPVRRSTKESRVEE